MCRCFYKSLPIFHGLPTVYEVIFGIIRLVMVFTSVNNNSYNNGNNQFSNQTNHTSVAVER